MKADCHIHMILDGVEWKHAISRHRQQPDEDFIRNTLQTYNRLGYTYLRDGGDRWGAGYAARRMAPEYGITYRTPGAPLCQAGHYGSFIGKTYETLKAYANLVKQAKTEGADFIKIMISGLMDFDRFGVLTEPGMASAQIRELIHIAHEEGFSVMAHANGAETVMAAAEAGVDSVEHGAYLNEEALCAMKESKTVWVPTVSTVANLRKQGRFREEAVEAILAHTAGNIQKFFAMGGLIAPGSDAGAWRVPHGCETETSHLLQLGVTEEALQKAVAVIRNKF